jgi:DNA-binding transcriptional LysR family regulator
MIRTSLDKPASPDIIVREIRTMSQIDRIRVFLRVAELSSFTAAGASLGLPKASVSTAISQLETELGARLLHRTTRKVSLTRDGQVFLERAQDLVADLDELTGLFQQEGTALRGRLRVDMPIGTACDVIIPRLPELLAEHPGLEIELSSTDRFVDVVREGFDCVLRVGVKPDSSLIARTLGHYRLINCASRGYVERFGTPRSIADLSEHRLVHYASTWGHPADGFEYVADGEDR